MEENLDNQGANNGKFFITAFDTSLYNAGIVFLLVVHHLNKLLLRQSMSS
ncbi:hypothetical protein BH11BAC5_BH11BAC5_51940 [soil metagenome]